ncbi:hypothetical protein L1987_52922 [Smallanthus sonchifolius]|uniref:Uncharacterized protein n=1 Tax=Smallanthus sonchifolius TaxID=185202 RepID=A0ACB9EVP3_9ASTR|nr:hypothetical protein L1987_52922 [Smallanthus sonchifolius]
MVIKSLFKPDFPLNLVLCLLEEIEQTMKTLFCVELTPTYITTLPFKNPSYNYTPAKRWKIHAKAKGFNGSNLENKKLMLNEEKKKKMKEADADDKIPDVVMQRIIVRILFNVGVPLVTGLGLLQVFSVIKEQNLWQIPRWLPFLTTFITFGASTLGIAYGTLSTSWDAENKGSVLGFEEAKKNWVQMWEEEDDS